MKEQSPVTATLTVDDRHFQKRIGYWSLVAIGVGSVIGSGWLFAAMYAAQAAGPASILTWVIGGAVMLALALVTAELAITHPESGGMVRYPLYSNGRLSGAMTGWCMLVSSVGVPALEASGVVQYLSQVIPGVFDDGQLTPPGVLLAAGLLAVFILLNFFGVKLFSESNNVITSIKIVIPVTAVIFLVVGGLTGIGGAGGFSNIEAGGGLTPFGAAAPLMIVATGGILFAFNGTQAIIALGGEVKNPRRTIPSAIITTMAFTILLYIGLQVAFLLASPQDQVRQGWQFVNFESPFAMLALLMGFKWIYWMLLADAMLSPSGSAVIAAGAIARNTYGMAKNGFLPRWLQKVDGKWGVPRRALTLNFVLGLCFLLPLPSWHAIVGVIGVMLALTLGVGNVSVSIFRRMGVSTKKTQVRGVGIIAPLTFVATALIVTWVPWSALSKTIPLLVAGAVWYAVTAVRQRHGRGEVLGGLWLIFFFAALYALCYLGSFGERIIPAPLDSLLVVLVAVGCFIWGVSSGVKYMSARPEIAESMRDARTDKEKLAALA